MEGRCGLQGGRELGEERARDHHQRQWWVDFAAAAAAAAAGDFEGEIFH